MGINKRETGKIYESKAVAFLQNKGYEIIERNYFTRYGEIDIIAKEDGYFVFIEVKYRKDNKSGSPESAVNSTKRRHMRQSALEYIVKKRGTDEVACRFDVVAFYGGHIHLIKDAFW